MIYKNIVFDLDGTLIDSNKAIIASLAHAFSACEIDMQIKPDLHLVGPPLRELVLSLVPQLSEPVLDKICSVFAQHYDQTCASETTLYPNIDEQLYQLQSQATHLTLATNKRKKPTQVILQQLQLSKYFDLCISPDSIENTRLSKTEMIMYTLDKLKLDPVQTIYIGDTHSDYISSLNSGVAFGHAEWGYGRISSSETILRINSPEKLMDILIS